MTYGGLPSGKHQTEMTVQPSNDFPKPPMSPPDLIFLRSLHQGRPTTNPMLKITKRGLNNLFNPLPSLDHALMSPDHNLWFDYFTWKPSQKMTLPRTIREVISATPTQTDIMHGHPGLYHSETDPGMKIEFPALCSQPRQKSTSCHNV